MKQLPIALIVEDDPSLRMRLADELEAAFNTVAASSADEALDVLEQRDDICVVFTNLQIPGSIDGIELAHCIRKRWPPVILVVTSGRHVSKSDLPMGRTFIAKTHQPHELSLLVRDVRRRLTEISPVNPPSASVHSAQQITFRRLQSPFHETNSAGFTQETNTWTLVADAASGDLCVEHQWSYVDPFGHGNPDRGTSTVSVESFLTGNADDDVKQKLRDILLSPPAL